jgi:hypothetical protein
MDAQAAQALNLRLEELIEYNMPGLSAKKAAALVEACLCCLMMNSHVSGVTVPVEREEGTDDTSIRLAWEGELTDQIKQTHNDEGDAAEDGAIAVSVLLAYHFHEHIVVSRSWKGTGFDYFLRHKNEDTVNPDLPFNSTMRLEVSGLFKQPRAKVNSRLKTKLDQTTRSDKDYSSASALIGIVEFGEPVALLHTRVTKKKDAGDTIT